MYSVLSRLLNHDANASKDQSMEVEFQMKLPDYHLYKDVHAGMMKGLPKVTTSRVDSYLTQFGKSLDEKSKALYSER